MKDVQLLVSEFNEINGLSLHPMCRALDLSSECGELQKEILLGCKYGKNAYKNTDNMQYEIGDCIYSLLSLCDELGLDLKSCLELSLCKMKDRTDLLNQY